MLESRYIYSEVSLQTLPFEYRKRKKIDIST